MSLSVFDYERNCFVLKPKKEVINAFHPDYVKTYMSDFLASIRTSNIKGEAGKSVTTFIEKRRKTNPTHGTFYGLNEGAFDATPKQMMKPPSKKPSSKKPHILSKAEQTMSMSEVMNELVDLLKPREYHIYAKAGVPKGKKK